MVEQYCAEHNIRVIRFANESLGVIAREGDPDVQGHIFILTTREELIIELNTEIDHIIEQARNLETQISIFDPNFISHSDY
jgi:uncharacterized protein Yka (UPF0111/DUF47 family)